MAFDMLKLIVLSLKFLIPYSCIVIRERIQGLIHGYTYKITDAPKNVVIIGGSFAGIELARRFAHSLPSGYRVLVVERNSHFNYTFNFPRYSVLQGREKLAFIPYGGLASSAPTGIFEHVHGEVTRISKGSIMLASGESIAFAYLVLATGATQKPPAKLSATEKDDACAELQSFQQDIKAADKVAIVGGGAVGVELATDIKSYHPEKAVTLIHSRDQLLPRFGARLHNHVMAALQRLNVGVVLGERPELQSPRDEVSEKASGSGSSTRFSDGRMMEFDLVISCTGQKANSSLIAAFLPDAVSKATGHIRVQSTLQISDTTECSNIFALGDIAETGGPKMARAALFQAAVVQKNVLSMIRGRDVAAQYQPYTSVEGSLKLTLGKSDWVVYTQTDQGNELLVSGRRGKDDLDVDRMWRHLGADIREVRRVM